MEISVQIAFHTYVCNTVIGYSTFGKVFTVSRVPRHPIPCPIKCVCADFRSSPKTISEVRFQNFSEITYRGVTHRHAAVFIVAYLRDSRSTS